MKQGTDEAAILSRIETAVESDQSAETIVQICMTIIQQELPAYKWVGVYWLNGEVLELGPYVGASTDHTTIKVGVGVCGQAVADNENLVVDDVRTLSNYLACSIETRSEIVVLIRDESGKVVGQIDADGHAVSDFDKRDEALLEKIATKLAAFAPHIP